MSRLGAVYGQGLYALAKDEGLEEQILQELTALDEAFSQQPDFLKLLASHNLPKQERTAILQDSFGGKVHTYVLNFLKILTEKGYIRHFSACCRAYRGEYNADKGILEVGVASAVMLNDDQKQRLTDKLTAITGKQVSLICKVDASVLGGIRLRFDDMQVDGTVQGRLAAMEKQLKNTVL